MLKKLLFAGVGLVLISSPIIASAQTVSVADQIAALQQQINQLLSQIAQLKTKNSSNGPIGASSPMQLATTCVDLQRTLTYHSVDTPGNNDVTQLQQYLNAKNYLHTDPTGYYGMLTLIAVGNLQIDLGLVPDSSDAAYGIFGPKTRQAISCGGWSDAVHSSGFSAAPVSGNASLSVTFSASNLDPNYQYSIDYGDDSGVVLVSQQCLMSHTGCGDPAPYMHTYDESGNYRAKLRQLDCQSNCPADFSHEGPIVGMVEIAVGDTSSNGQNGGDN